MKVGLTQLGGKGLTCSDDEWRTRVDLAACYRLVEHFGMTDLVYSHISAMVPGEPERFLLNPYGLMFDEVTASNLVKVDLDGTIVGDGEHGINPSGFALHATIHRARADAVCVVHCHSKAGSAVSALKSGLMVLDQEGAHFHARVAYHDWEGIAFTDDEKARLLANLGDKRVMILRNHGLLTTGRSVAEAFRYMYYLERACRVQLDVLATGAEIVRPAPEELERTAAAWEESNADATRIREWPAFLRMLDRMDPSYRD